ncbi:Increased DNA methylation 2 [Capsicum baccatum]|uniref:Increased DNA methylation 2 n=1 Tax=Capsicum baccatum TaxID=33114 RepID=A0A2G2W7G3_CAPBA|nr:Increased DNA methylation 2 [Capsicum baccatum]
MTTECLIRVLLAEDESVSSNFLLHLFKIGLIMNINAKPKNHLKTRIALMLEKCSSQDLLVRNSTTVFDVDIVVQVVGAYVSLASNNPKSRMFAVGRLVDEYLALIARDENLVSRSLDSLVNALPKEARFCDDTYIEALQGKFIELVNILRKWRISTPCVQETKWVGSKVRDVDRASQSSVPNSGEANSSISLHPQLLNVAAISLYPCTGPPLPYSYHASSSSDFNASSISVEATREEWDNLINHANGGVALTGSVLLGKVGPLIGAVDTAESEDAYVFRVSLPGVARDEKVFRCDVGLNGRILIKGVSVTGERKVRRKNMVFKMQTQNLCPPGEFTGSFQLRGPIDHLNLSCNFGPDGIFEGVTKKNQHVL